MVALLADSRRAYQIQGLDLLHLPSAKDISPVVLCPQSHLMSNLSFHTLFLSNPLLYLLPLVPPSTTPLSLTQHVLLQIPILFLLSFLLHLTLYSLLLLFLLLLLPSLTLYLLHPRLLLTH